MEESARKHGTNTHFVWEPPARDISIYLSLQVIERLQALVRESRDQEIGGLLLGRCDRFQGTSERRIVVIDDFEPLDSEHLRGPAYALSQQDTKALERTLLRARANEGNTPVGFFRSHLRKGIYLDEADFSVFQAYFSSPCDVFLVARPQDSDVPMAGFFYWQDEAFERRTSYLQFPLDRTRLETGGYSLGPTGDSRSDPAVAVAAGAVDSDEELQRDRASRARRVQKAFYATLGSCLILTAVVCAVMLRSGGTEVSLSVERDGPSLKLSWDAGAPTIAHANSAVLLISDGGQQKKVHLDADQLRSGGLTYTPASSDVNFRLDLLKVSVQGTESVHYVADKQASAVTVANAGPPPALPLQPAARAPEPPAIPARETARRTKPVTRDDNQDDPQHAADRAMPSERTAKSAQPPVVNPPQLAQTPAGPPPQTQQMAKAATPDIPDQAKPAAPPALNSQPAPFSSTQQAAARPRVDPTVNISTKAIPPRRIQDWLTKVPLVRAFRGRPKEEDFVAPRPSHQVTPRVPWRVARVLPGDWSVELKLSLDSEGRVKDLELMSPGSDDRLVDISAEAMRQWRFEPARFRDKPVHCDVLATVHFHNPMPDAGVAQRQ